MKPFRQAMKQAIEDRNWTLYEDLVKAAHDAQLRRKDEAYQQRARAHGNPNPGPRPLGHTEHSPWWNTTTGAQLASKIQSLEEIPDGVEKFVESVAAHFSVPSDHLS